MRQTLAEIARLVGGEVVGDGSIVITGISGLKEASEGDLSFLSNPKYAQIAASTKASGILVARDVTIEGKSVIRTDNPSMSFAQVVNLIKEDHTPRVRGIHPTAVIAPDAVIGEGSGIGPHVVVERGARIGRNAIICAGVYIGQNCVVGDKTLVYPNVTIREDVVIGNNVIIHSGTVVGSDGFGYLTIGDRHEKVPQMGTVVVEDDVEIGACVTVDRARFDKTVIGRGTKIDNLVQIAHNVRIGENCIVVAQVGIAGSATLGRNVIIAGQVGVAGHTTVGDRAIVMAQSGTTRDVPAGAKMFGTPAEEYKETVRNLGYVSRLGKYVERIKALEAKVAALEEKSSSVSS